MNDEIEDLIQETEITLRDAYNRGLNKGGELNRTVRATVTQLISAFTIYTTKNYRQSYNTEDDLIYTHKETNQIQTLPQLIKTFLLSYDYGQD
jgi:hypothetical protein